MESEEYVISLQEQKLQSKKSIITLLTIGNNHVAVMFLLKKYLSITYEEAKFLISQPPIEIAYDSKRKLTSLTNELRSVGAKVNLTDVNC